MRPESVEPGDDPLPDTLRDREDLEGRAFALEVRPERPNPAAGRGADAAERLSQLARGLGVQGRLPEAHRALDEAERLAGPGADAPRGRLRARLERGRLHAQAGDVATARGCFVEAWELARQCGEDFHAIDAAHMLAIVEGDESSAWSDRALRLTEASAQPDARSWLGTLHHNLGVKHLEREDPDQAARHLRLALVDYEARGDGPGVRSARCYLARALRLLGGPAEALAMLLAEGKVTGRDVLDGLVLAEIGECLLALGRAAEARPRFAEAYRLVSPHAPKGSPPWLQRLAERGRPAPEGAGS